MVPKDDTSNAEKKKQLVLGPEAQVRGQNNPSIQGEGGLQRARDQSLPTLEEEPETGYFVSSQDLTRSGSIRSR